MRFIIFILFLIILGLGGFWLLANKETPAPTAPVVKEIPLPNPASIPAGTAIDESNGIFENEPEEDSGAEE